MLAVVGVGLLAGWHAANWGAYKDVPYEGFRWSSYLRSLLVAGLAALLLDRVLGERLPPLLVTLGVVYTIERFTTEWWKSILREQDQSGYTIPMRLGVRGRTVDRRAPRYVAGIGTLVALVLLCLGGALVQAAVGTVPAVVTVLLGGVGGWLTAVGGAWKDAPIEGFSGWKFLRSPAVATAWAVPLSFLTTGWVALAVSSAGFAVASIETYKTFLTGGRAPGKFEGKPVRHVASAARARFALLHALLWAALAVGAGGAVLSGEVTGGAAVAVVIVGIVALALACSVPVATSWVSLRRGAIPLPDQPGPVRARHE